LNEQDTLRDFEIKKYSQDLLWGGQDAHPTRLDNLIYLLEIPYALTQERTEREYLII